ncbi:MAG: hypothetical protein ACSLE2_14260 [Lysobacterales bacterium]
MTFLPGGTRQEGQSQEVAHAREANLQIEKELASMAVFQFGSG